MVKTVAKQSHKDGFLRRLVNVIQKRPNDHGCLETGKNGARRSFLLYLFPYFVQYVWNVSFGREKIGNRPATSIPRKCFCNDQLDIYFYLNDYLLANGIQLPFKDGTTTETVIGCLTWHPRVIRTKENEWQIWSRPSSQRFKIRFHAPLEHMGFSFDWIIYLVESSFSLWYRPVLYVVKIEQTIELLLETGFPQLI